MQGHRRASWPGSKIFKWF